MGDFSSANRLLEQAFRASEAPGQHQLPDAPELTGLHRNADRILDLLPTRQISSEQRVSSLLSLKDIARAGLDACTSTSPSPPLGLDQVDQRWAEGSRSATRSALLHNPSTQDDLAQLILDTEVASSRACGPPSGDDALLLLLAQQPRAVERYWSPR